MAETKLLCFIIIIVVVVVHLLRQLTASHMEKSQCIRRIQTHKNFFKKLPVSLPGTASWHLSTTQTPLKPLSDTC